MQGWVFNAVPWLISIPCQWFSGWFADHLISKGLYALCSKNSFYVRVEHSWAKRDCTYNERHEEYENLVLKSMIVITVCAVNYKVKWMRLSVFCNEALSIVTWHTDKSEFWRMFCRSSETRVVVRMFEDRFKSDALCVDLHCFLVLPLILIKTRMIFSYVILVITDRCTLKAH